MSSLESSTERDETTEEGDETTGETSTGSQPTVTVAAGDEIDVSLPDDATPAEAAAITAAIGSHLAARQRAAAAAAAAEESVEYTDEWKLTGRLERFGKRRRPRNVERGDEWKAAARARY